MKQIFNRLPFSLKLLMVGLLPLFFLLYVSIDLYKEKAEKSEVALSFFNQMKETAAISMLVDNLQAERKFTFSHVLTGKEESSLMVQRAQTDEAVMNAESLLKDRLQHFREYSMLKNLNQFRGKIVARNIDPEEVMIFYTNIILRLNLLSTISTENIPYLHSLNKDIKSQQLLSQMITQLGVLRANIYQSLLSKAQTNGERSQNKNDLAFFKSLESEFLHEAPTNVLRNYGTLIRSGSIQKTLRTINQAANVTDVTSLTSAEDWWQTSGDAVKTLKILQRQCLQKAEETAQQIYNDERNSKNKNMIIILCISLFVILIISYIISNITSVLNELQRASERLAEGITGNKFSIHTDDVIGKLGRAILRIDSSNLEIATAATKIGRGDFEAKIAARSPDDELGTAIVLMRNNLYDFSLKNEEKLWLRTSVAAMDDVARGEKTLVELTTDSIETLACYMNIQTSVFYVSDGDQLTYSSGFSVANESLIPKTIHLGETLVGQAALSKKITYLNSVPDEFIKIRSGSGETNPTHIIIVPLIANGFVEGVVELGALQPFSEKDMELITMMAPGLAIAIQMAKSRMKLKELLEETQVQSEELQAQHTEMEVINADLEMQSQQLQASEEELRVQQEELQQLNGELEERTSLLEEKNIQIKKKSEELEQTSRYKSEFLANVSHELRTPLNSIILLSRLLYENNDLNLNEEQVEFAKVIQASGNGLLGLIDEILDLSKIEAGKMQLDFVAVPIKEITSDLDSLFKTVAKEKGLLFKVEADESLGATIDTDKVSLEQVLKNLISNALKFTAEGSVSLLIKGDLQSNRVKFIVSDTGIGIPKDKQHLIFEAFQQADGSTKRKYGGTGLGLSISRELVKLLGGEITLTSEPGKGSSFVLELPIKAESAKGPVPVIEPISESAASDTSTITEEHRSKFISTVIPESVPDDRDSITKSDKTILIIEDDTNFAKSLLEYTRKKGYKGIVAVRGDEGVTLAGQFMPLGILLDIQLPVKSGWMVMDELKANHKTRHIPVHMMSSYHLKNESLMKGAVDFINKPMAFEQMHDIFKKIEYVLERKSKRVLIVEENSKHAQALAYYLETYKISSEVRDSIDGSVEALQDKKVDCVILDMGIPDAKSYETLEAIKQNAGLENLPIIIFTGKSLSKGEEARIKKYSDSIVVKTAQSYQRVLDEVSMFLHIVEEPKEPNPSNGNVKNGDIKKLGALAEVLNGKTVLIVDDDVRNIFSLSKALENYKINVITASDGKEALQKLNENSKTDLVLLDMMMPEMDGYETATRIRKDARWKYLPVIAVTAKAMSGDREKCIKAGSSDYITKPVDIDQLISLLRVWLYEQTIPS